MKRREDADNNCERDKELSRRVELKQGENVEKKERERESHKKKKKAKKKGTSERMIEEPVADAKNERNHSSKSGMTIRDGKRAGKARVGR